jgi:hypothetical protein
MDTSNERATAMLPRCDVELLGLHWTEGGRDIALRLLLPGSGSPGDRVREVACRCATALAVHLQVPEGRGGSPLTWDSSYHREPDGSWTVRLDFGADGWLQLRCSDVEVGSPACLPRGTCQQD